jgi:hypothetical protein
MMSDCHNHQLVATCLERALVPYQRRYQFRKGTCAPRWVGGQVRYLNGALFRGDYFAGINFVDSLWPN